MAAEYEASERIASIARDLIPLHHSHLESAKIAYMMKVAPKEKSGPPPPARMGKRPAAGKARTVSAIYHALTGFDFIIEVDEVYWDLLDLDQQAALVDHELTHCARDEKGWYIKDHDVEEFVRIAGRHGAWHTNIELFEVALQGNLPFDESAKAEAAVNQVQ